MSKRKLKQKKVKLDTFCKLIVALTVIHGMALSTLSYVLAFCGKETVAEVSTVIVTEILAPVVTYLATNTIANIFEKNYLSFSLPKDSEWAMNKLNSEKYERTR